MAPKNSTELAVVGMTCSNCARHVGEALQKVDGVETATVSLEEGRATVRWRPDTEPAEDRAIRAVQDAGYQAQSVDSGDESSQKPAVSPLDAWKRSVILGASLTVPLAVGEWGLGVGGDAWFHWVGLALSVPVMVLCGGRFFRGAWKQLQRGRSNMDTLVALGSTTAFGFSVWGLLSSWPGHLYFMEAGAIITLISAGHWLEALASARASSSLQSLLHLAPQTARVIDSEGKEREAPVSSLRLGDRVALRPGDHVPTDGEVLDGHSAIDESMLTGESMPVEKSVGSRVYAGTTNTSGRLIVGVSGTGEETALARIVAVVQRAQASRAGIQRLGDAVASVFVPVVVLVAIASGLWWGLATESALEVHQTLAGVLWFVHLPATPLASAFVHAAAVLIVACPCAMGLATPVAILVGTSVAARRGILIRDGVALEKSGTITAVVFDKTGTLTRGEVSVEVSEDLRAPQERSPAVSELARSLSSPSSHPLSRALANAGSEIESTPAEPIALEGWEELRGRGVAASLHGVPLRLGSLAWIRESGVDVERASSFAEEWSGRGATVLALACGDKLAGLFALRDSLKPGAAEVVRDLRARGLKTYLITGDGARTAHAIAEQAGIASENVLAEVRPEDKAREVESLQKRGEKVSFVGDGINDAPALEQADLGIAVSRASDVAREASDMVLLSSDIHAIPEALGVARATLRTIRQNLFWAFFYNAAAVPLAALGFLHPIICAAAMGVSDLVVIGNALRLRVRR